VVTNERRERLTELDVVPVAVDDRVIELLTDLG
jgi:hypothetical protein